MVCDWFSSASCQSLQREERMTLWTTCGATGKQFAHQGPGIPVDLSWGSWGSWEWFSQWREWYLVLCTPRHSRGVACSHMRMPIVACSGPVLPDLTSPKAREWGRGNERNEHPGDPFPLRVLRTRRSLVIPGHGGTREHRGESLGWFWRGTAHEYH